ncbi:phage baseplate plug family protein [Pantoea stewartii]|uniref:phage baseplate plug family protein n=1 Tax=Pantoea stewartii TaxID=66269 RepID=UPI0019813916|nr:hypothetical protein [Pantoea stewartii]
MQIITLQPIKAQELTVRLGDQNVTLRIYQRTTGLYVDIGLGDLWIAQGVICINGNRLVRYSYLGFKGDLFFADLKGSSDPTYDGLGDRYVLFYATADEMSSAA